MSNLRIFLLGKFDILNDVGHVANFDKSNVQQLFSYLLLFRRRQHTRESLATLLWPDAGPTQAKAYLRKTLWQLQKAINEGSHETTRKLLLVEPEWICLNPRAGLWLDVARLEHAFQLTEGKSGSELNQAEVQVVQEAVELYRDDLLVGCTEDWCLYERERLYRLNLILLDKLTNYCLQHQLFESGLTYATRILRFDPARERTHRALMRLFYLTGDRTAALQQYNHCAAMLREALDVAPARRTQLLYEALCVDDPAGIWAEPADQPLPSPLVEALRSLERVKADLFVIQDRVEREISSVQRQLHDQR